MGKPETSQSGQSELERYIDEQGEMPAGRALLDMVESRFEELVGRGVIPEGFTTDQALAVLKRAKVSKSDDLETTRVKVATALSELRNFGTENLLGFFYKLAKMPEDEFTMAEVLAEVGDGEIDYPESEDQLVSDIYRAAEDFLGGAMGLLVEELKSFEDDGGSVAEGAADVHDYRHYCRDEALVAAGFDLDEFDKLGFHASVRSV